mgnify:CR=1 FL=1
MPRSSREISADRAGENFWSAAPSGDTAWSFDPLVHLRSILQHKWPILAVTSIAALLAIVYTTTATPLYRATQVLLLESTDTNVVAVEELVRTAGEEGGYVQTQIEILRSRDIGERVIDSLDLLAEPSFVDGLARKSGLDPARLLSTGDGAASDGAAPVERIAMAESRALAIDFLIERLSVREVPTTRLLRIGFLSPDPELAANVANEVGLQYILNHVETNRELIGEVSGWLDGRLAELKGNLDLSERRLLEFKSENGLFGVGGDVGKLGELELLQSAAELTEARLKLSSVDDQLEGLRAEDTLQGRLARLQSDTLIQQTRVDIRRVTREIERLSTQYGPRHPRRLELNSELDVLQASLDQAVLQAIASLENERQLLTSQVASLEARLAASRDTVRDVDTKSVELALLQREVQTNRELYYRFFDRMLEARSTEGLESTNATVVEFARPALSPAKPDKAFIVVLATLGALACATLAAIVVNAFDDSIRRTADVERRLGTRLLGVIPAYRRKRGGLGRLLRFGGAEAEEKADRMFAEAYKSVRTHLLLGDRAGERRVMLLTSAVPGEGKSMSSICLARTLAPTERVLLIDADIRRPSIGRALRLDVKAPGLTHVLAGRGGATRFIQSYATGGFDVLPSGFGSDHPLELLSSARMESMLTELAGSYDRIVIDCAPVEAVSDALILSHLADLVIYVAKSHDTSLRVVANGLEKLRAADAPLAGVLLTQVDLDKLATYGADYEFHGYYGYGDYSSPANGSALSLDWNELRDIGRLEKSRPRRRRVGAEDSGTVA